MLGKSIANTQQSGNDMRQQWSHFCPKKWISSCWNPHHNLINLLCQREVCRLFGAYYFDRNILFYFIYLNCDLNLGDGQTAPSSLLPPTPLFLQPPPPLMYFFTCFIKQRQRRAMDTWSQQEHDLHLKGYSGHILVILEEEIYLSGRFFRAIIFCSRINFSLGN